MESVKDNFNFCKAAVFYDYKNWGVTDELNQARKCIINNFHETKPVGRILITLSVTDFVILEINNIDIENVIEKIHDFRENILYMLSFEKVIREDNEK